MAAAGPRGTIPGSQTYTKTLHQNYKYDTVISQTLQEIKGKVPTGVKGLLFGTSYVDNGNVYMHLQLMSATWFICFGSALEIFRKRASVLLNFIAGKHVVDFLPVEFHKSYRSLFHTLGRATQVTAKH